MRILPILVLAALALAGCGGSGSETSSPSEAATSAPSGNGPDISGAGLDGEALSVADFRGKPVFVNVWSSW